MGHRTLKRVALEFNWPQKKTWKGYTNPYPGPLTCNPCGGSGYNSATKQVADEFYDHDGDGSRRWCDNITQDEVEALVKEDRLWDFTRVPLNEKQREDVRKKMAAGGNSWLPYENGRIPTADEVNRWNQRGLGHDAINRWILIETRCKRLGIWGKCKICKGHGEKFPKGVSRHKYKSWREYEPPAGPCFQLWDTSGGDCPISPVFRTIRILAEWCAENATIFADEKASFETWYKMFYEEVYGDGPGTLDVGSLLIISSSGYCGSIANMPAGT